MATAIAEVTPQGVDKVARYGWKVTSDKGEFKWIPKRLLRINTDVYQREATKQKVKELRSNWSWIACNTLVVARREGAYWVVDGGHRKLAADSRSDITDMPCMVFDVEDVKDEAKAFLATNDNRKPVSALGKFKAYLGADDPVAKFISDVVRGCGLRLATASSEAGDFKAVALARKLVEQDRDGFVAVMQIAAEIALAEGSPVHNRIVQGLYHIHRSVGGGLDNQRLAKRIKQLGMAALVKGADSAAGYYGKGGAAVYADGMLQVINKGLRTRFELGK